MRQATGRIPQAERHLPDQRREAMFQGMHDMWPMETIKMRMCS